MDETLAPTEVYDVATADKNIILYYPATAKTAYDYIFQFNLPEAAYPYNVRFQGTSRYILNNPDLPDQIEGTSNRTYYILTDSPSCNI